MALCLNLVVPFGSRSRKTLDSPRVNFPISRRDRRRKIVCRANAGIGGSTFDVDGDGLANNIAPFSRDASNGANNVISAGNSLNFGFNSSFDDFSGSVGFGGGFTGLAVNGAADFEQADLSNVVLDSANGGTFTINDVSNGDAFVDINSGECRVQQHSHQRY